MTIKVICLAYIQYTITGQVQDTTVNTPGGKGEERKSHGQPIYMMMTSCRTIYQEPTTIPPHHTHALGQNVNCLPYLEPFHAYSLGRVLSVEQTSTLCTQSLPNPWLDTVNSYLKMCDYSSVRNYLLKLTLSKDSQLGSDTHEIPYLLQNA